MAQKAKIETGFLGEDAVWLIHTLEKAGFEAYAVGGCVRDALMGLPAKDIDITTSARPEQVKALFPRTFDTGIEHGTITVLLHGTGYEVTTFRTEEGYSDHRRPDHVSYTLSLEEDLSRRDFTINAMAFHPDSARGVIDPFGGREDLENHLIRCVGDPFERFNEDALRMLRAVRFAARFGFEIEEKTRDAIGKLAPTLRYVSRERVFEELKKTLLSDHPTVLQQALILGLCPYMSAALSDGKQLLVQALQDTEKDLVIRLAVLFSSMGAGRTEKILTELKSDNTTKESVLLLLAHLDDPVPKDGASMRRLMAITGKQQALSLLKVKKAAGLLSDEGYEQALSLWMQELDSPVTLKELQISGKDLILLGMAQGKTIGAALEYLLNRVLENPELNDRQRLIELLDRHWYNKQQDFRN